MANAKICDRCGLFYKGYLKRPGMKKPDSYTCVIVRQYTEEDNAEEIRKNTICVNVVTKRLKIG